MVEKNNTLAIFSDKYLRSYSCSDINFTATVNCTNPKTQILSEIIEIPSIGIPVDFLFLCQWKTWMQQLFKLKAYWRSIKVQKRIKNIDVWLLFWYLPFLLIFVVCFRSEFRHSGFNTTKSELLYIYFLGFCQLFRNT